MSRLSWIYAILLIGCSAPGAIEISEEDTDECADAGAADGDSSDVHSK
jgi:hypothetical protein